MAVCNRTIVRTLEYLDLGLWRERWERMCFQSAVQGSSGVDGEKMYCYGYQGMCSTDF
jgi:hypothetical protein